MLYNQMEESFNMQVRIYRVARASRVQVRNGSCVAPGCRMCRGS